MGNSDKFPHAPAAEHFDRVVEAITIDKVVPFLGAGANLCGHNGADWDPNSSTRLPLGGELARYLASQVNYQPRSFKANCVCHKKNNLHEFQEVAEDLLRISQYVQLTRDEKFLYNRLNPLFDRDYPPTLLHWLLANLPAKLAQHNHEVQHILVVTTNYDDVMERAFEMVGEPYDVLYYAVKTTGSTNFVHKSRDGKLAPVPPNSLNVSLDHGSVVLKIHGGVRRRPRGDSDEKEMVSALEYPSSYVITEDNYIDYLTRVNPNDLPIALRRHIVESDFLFLGYSLRDWNLRAFLHQIRGMSLITGKSWAIQRGADALDVKFWGERQVDIFDADLHGYAAELCRRLSIPPMPEGSGPAARAAGGPAEAVTT